MKTIFNYHSLKDFADAIIYSEIFFSIEELRNPNFDDANYDLISFYAKASGTSCFFEVIAYQAAFTQDPDVPVDLLLNKLMHLIARGKFCKSNNVAFIKGNFRGLKIQKKKNITTIWEVNNWLKNIERKEVSNGN